MAVNFRDVIRNVFHSDEKEKEEEEKKATQLQNKVNGVFGTNAMNVTTQPNPFIKEDGSLVNPNLNYQQLVDNPKVSTQTKEYITQATGVKPTPQNVPQAVVNGVQQTKTQTTQQTQPTTDNNSGVTVKFDANADANNLGKLDIITGVPKLTVKQIEAIIQKHYSKSKVISPSDAQAIYNAQNSSGISALVTLGIGALESGWGTSNIANKTHNLWGYGATNDNPEGNAHKYTSMEDAALRYSNSLKKDYYNGYGAKTIYAIGTGNNPAGKGYAYNNDGTISTTWYTSVNSIMGTLYNTAKSVQ